MTDKNDDSKSWLAAQFAASDDDNAPSENEKPPSVEAASGSPRRVWSIDNDLPLRRPQLPTGSGYAWGLTPGGGQVPDAPAAGDPSSPVPPTGAAPAAPDAPIASVASVDREAPDSQPSEVGPLPVPVAGVRAFYPEPSAAATGHAPPAPASADASASAAASATGAASASGSAAATGPTSSPAGPRSTAASGGDSPQPVPSSTVDVPQAPAPSAQSVAASPAEVASTSSIPTIEEVLDSPSPRRAAREAAILEAAAREAATREATLRREAHPESTRPSDQMSQYPPAQQPDESVQAAAASSAGLLGTEFPDTPLHNSEEADSEPQRSHPAPLNARGSSYPTVAPIDEPHAPIFVDQGDQAADSGATGRRSSSPGAGEAPKPRNQRIVLFVLIGLVIALGLVLAANFFL